MSWRGMMMKFGLQSTNGVISSVRGALLQAGIVPGNEFYVKPSSGNDSASGRSPATALKTLSAALGMCTANNHDVVYLIGESNTAASTTDYQSATLDWNKDLTHLVGWNPSSIISPRARVALTSGYVTASNLFTLSADGCLVGGIQFYAGVADAHPTGCFKVTGTRNRLLECHLAGIGNDANDIAGAYSLFISGGQENWVERCVIGLDTVARGTALNSEIRFASAASRNVFLDCLVLSQLEHASNHPYIYVDGATGIDRFNLFKRCTFLKFSTNYVYAQDVALLHSVTPTQGVTVFDDCGIDASAVCASGKHALVRGGAIDTAYTAGTFYSA